MNDTTKNEAKGIGVRKIEKADEPVFECACCGKMHRKIHHMSNGAIMGQQCALSLESFSWRAKCGDARERGGLPVAEAARVCAGPRLERLTRLALVRGPTPNAEIGAAHRGVRR